MKSMRLGLDLAKNIFEVFAVDQDEKVLLRKTIKRSQVLEFFGQQEPCIVGMESCGGAHYWARELQKLGHEVRMMAPQFVAPYRKSDKNDRNDAEAICEAAGRPNMRFVPIKNEGQQAILTVHRASSLLVAERVSLINQIRGFLTEYGIVIPQGRLQVRSKLPEILENGENTLPYLAREVLSDQYRRLCELDRVLDDYDQKISSLSKSQEVTRRLMEAEGIGLVTATAIVASAGDLHDFKNGRQFASLARPCTTAMVFRR